MKKTLLFCILLLCIIYGHTQNPGNIGTTNLTAWFDADALPIGPTTTWTTSFPTGGSALTLTDALAPFPTTTNTPPNATSNYRTTIDFSGNSGASLRVLENLTALDLLDNQFANNEGTFFSVYYLPATNACTGCHIVVYREASGGNVDGIQFRVKLGNGNGRIALGSGNSVNGSRDWTQDFIPDIISYTGNRSGPGTMRAFERSLLFTNNPGSSSTGTQGLIVGSRKAPNGSYNAMFDGFLSEIIFYDKNLSDLEYDKVHTYLGIKYSITLDNTGGGTQGDYISTNGTTVWDASLSPAYHNDVIGLANDLNEGLTQKQSHSFDDVTRMYLGTLATTNAGNNGTFNADNTYLVLGHNNGVMCSNPATNTEFPSGMDLGNRLDREWKITTTNYSETFSLDLTIDACGNNLPTDPADIKFLVDTDGDFSNATVYDDGGGVTISYSAGVVTVSGISTAQIPNNSTRYLTLAFVGVPTCLPEITCPVDLTVDCIDDIVLDPNNATATSACANIAAVYIKNPHINGVPNCDGTIYTYIYVVVDEFGNTSECEQQVLIENDPATLTVPTGGTVSCFEDIDISVDDAIVNGACAAYDLYLVPPALNGASGCPGTTYTYTYRLIDACGRTVEEPVVFNNGANAAPTITAPADVTCSCLGGITPNPDNAMVSTSCGTSSTVTVTGPQIFGPVDCNGTVYRYTYTVTDDCGRMDTDIQDFTVNNGPPVFENCPEDNWLVLNCEDYGGEGGTIAVIQAWIASVKASSSCGVELTVFNNFNPNNINTCINNGYNTVTFRATDNCGRSSFCTGVYVVVDTEAPEIIEEAQDHWEMCNYNTQANLTAWVQNHGGAIASDGCSGGNISWQASPANPQINCIGAMGTTSVTVQFIVTDNCGNKTTTSATFNALMASGTDFNDPDGNDQLTEFNDQAELFQNQPNPFKDETRVGFYLPEDMGVTLVIYDISGKEVKRIAGDFSKGYNSLNINRAELSATGILLYQLNTKLGSITKRMILIE